MGPVPFQALVVASGEQTDRRLRVLSAPPYAIIGHDATIRVQVEDLGPQAAGQNDPGAHATLSLRRDGEAPIVREVQVGVAQDITLPVTHPGAMLVQLTASTLPARSPPLNNQTVVQINGVRDRLRVLLVSGAPNQGERVWRRLLKADPAVDLVHFTILRPPDKDDTTPLNELALIAFPTRELFQEKIDSFDLIILDGFENRGILPLAYLQNIADFVRGGGGLLLTAGPEFIGRGSLQDTPLGDHPAGACARGRRPAAAPLPAGAHHARAAPSGHCRPAADPYSRCQLGVRLGPLVSRPAADQSHGEVLLTSPDGAGGQSPLLVLDHVDRGRVAVLLSDQIWLWSRGEGGRRSAGGAAAPDRALADEGAGSRGGAAAAPHRAGPPAGDPPLDRRPGGARRAGGWRRTAIAAACSWPPPGEACCAAAARRRRRVSGKSPTAPGTPTRRRCPATPRRSPICAPPRPRLAPVAARTGGGVAWLGDDAARIAVPQLRLVPRGATAHGDGWIGLARTARMW